MMATADGKFSGFSIMEVENEEQMAKYIIQFTKAGKRNMRAVPIWETSKTKKYGTN
jgi:carboxylesterase type B